MISTVLGGIMMARLPAEAKQPVRRASSYPYRFISGRVTLPMAAAAAVVEPHMAPNPAQAAMVASARPPGRRPSHLWAASKSRPLMPE